ncbi:penicillin acylase family protein [Sphingomonas bacterium]|uniref:penicillin acylase family protein n=1 Tax=Sphingomonas bacterium TaxID=1895847 RepID=UPI0015770872|nr:penicillin acylase family protein [Sphingomonas bacterium]
MKIGWTAWLAMLLPVPALAATPEHARWDAQARGVTITRDDWGIAHVHGHGDADAVFGMIYAQAEDDFNRIEVNYLTALGRRAEAEGDALVWQDLRQRLFVNPVELQAQYARSPNWLQALMTAWADGLNYYLATHPKVHPKVLTRFEPWMALSFSEGSIGGDIERASLARLEAFYGKRAVALNEDERGAIYREPKGSNGIAIAPANTVGGHALLLINPHTSFFFRSEQQVTSDAGLDVYGAATWGQFFIYQGWNRHAGWMHTSSGVDNVDEFAEDIVRQGDRLFYRYGKELRPVAIKTVTIAVRGSDGRLSERRFTIYATHHGPIVREEGGKWLALALMNRPVEALQQSFLRTKAADFAAFRKVAELKANSSNDTVFADDRGTIAFLMPQFLPVRDNRFDYTKPVDGSDPATDWHGLHTLDQLPQVVNPKVGWIRNTNDWPWSVSGPDSPAATAYPRYLDQAGENPRGLHADLLLTGRRDFTLPGLIGAAYDSYLPAFARVLPSLFASYDALPATDPRRAKLAAPVALLRGWDQRWSAESAATSLAVFWGEALWKLTPVASPGLAHYDAMAAPGASEARLTALQTAVDRLTEDFGDWRTPWGRINRFQRVDDAIAQRFDDAKPSIPVPFTSSQWGSLASFGAPRQPGTKRLYGTSGNSFVAAVEFGGPRVVARAVTAGGESGDPASPHFGDQAAHYAGGQLRPVYFYPDELKGHVERVYHPGG